MPHADPVKRRAYMRARYAKTRSVRRAYGKAWRKQNPRRYAGYQKAYYLKNREAILEKGKKYPSQSPEQVRDRHLRRTYDITLEDEKRMVIEQSGKCACCGVPLKRNYVDHDHITRKVRGIVCCRCNIRLSAADDAEWLEQARVYKEKSHAS